MKPSEIKNLRASLGISQTAFGQLIGVAMRTVQDWEAGLRKPGGPAVKAMESMATPGKFLCPDCHRPLHKFHNCTLNPVAEPGKGEGEKI